MTSLKWLAPASLVLVLCPAVYCEKGCPGDAASIPLSFVGHSLITVPVMLDGNGPYEFLLDTGAQITSVDTRLASKLGPRLLGETHVTGVGTYSAAEYAQLHLLETGKYSMKGPLVLIRDLTQMRLIDGGIRGILGENFLERYDLLIDYRHRFLCLDDAKQMQKKIKGERVELARVPHEETYLPFTLPSIVSTHVSGIANRKLLLQLDSGIDLPLLFECGKELPLVRYFSSTVSHNKNEEVVDTFATLQPQDIQVGDSALRNVSFVTPVTAGKAIGQKPDVDGVLPTALFQRVFISHADRFAILQR